MFQPPLYYLASALVLDGCGRSVGDEDAVYFLRAVNGVIGLLHCWVVFLCLRLLFWGNLPAQAAGLLVAAFLPPHLYLSQYVTNEPLAGFLVTVAIYFCLRVLRAEKEGLWMPIGIGVALGAAMLAKFSVLLALPFFPVALSQRLAGREESTRGGTGCAAWARSSSGCLMVCGWHYGRVWARFGKPIVGNWDAQSGQGDRDNGGMTPVSERAPSTLSFGRALVSPSFSGFHSFADGIYSTLWGDGLASAGGIADASYQPPWNYDLMGAGYWVSLGVSLLLIIGAALVLAKIMQSNPRRNGSSFSAWSAASASGCFGCTLVMPYYAQVQSVLRFPGAVTVQCTGGCRVGLAAPAAPCRGNRCLGAAYWFGP